MVIDYKIIKYCRHCKVRFVVQKGQSKIYLCPDCQKKQDEYNEAHPRDE